MSQEIITRIENFAASSGKSESTIARKVFNDGKTLTRLRSGGQLTPRTQEKAMAALDTLEREAAGPMGQRLTHLDRLEAESIHICLLYTSPSPRDRQKSRMPSSA